MPTQKDDGAAKPAAKTPRKRAPRNTTAAKESTSAKATTASKTRSSAKAKPSSTNVAKRVPVKKTAETVSEKGNNIAIEAKEKAGEFAKETQKRAGAAIANVAELINESAGSIDERLGERYGDVARSASETVAGVAARVDESDLSELADEARNFVRKSPALAIGLAVTAGLVVARLVKSTRD